MKTTVTIDRMTNGPLDRAANHAKRAATALSAAWVASFLLCCGSTRAATTVWVGSSSGGVFNTDSNWSSLAPGDSSPSDLGIFNSATNVNGTITFNADASHFRTFVQDTSGTISFDTGPHKWTMSSFFLAGTGAGEVNTIKLINGTIQDAMILLGNDPGSSGNSIEVTGAGSLWSNTDTGAAVRVGSGGSANTTFTIDNGGKVTSAGQTIVGLAGSSNGKLLVTDTGVLQTANYLGVGHTAGTTANATNNEADILNGGTAVAQDVLMGITTGATDNRVLVSGSGSTLTLTGVGAQTQIGMAGINNSFQVSNGGAVLGSSKFRLGVGSASTGNSLVINNGTLTGTGIEAIRGDVTITNSSVDLSDYFMTPSFIEGSLAATGVGTSTITFNSGTIKTVRSNIVNGLPFTVGDGGVTPATYTMKKTGDGLNGLHTFANGLFLNSNAVLNGNGDIAGDVSGAAGATVDVGTSPGVIDDNGAWNNTALNVDLQVGNLATVPALPGVGYDLLNVTGPFTHGGNVNIDVSGFSSGSGHTQDIKLIGWTSEVGSSAATHINFVGGSALPYAFRSDGLYLTNVSFTFVPEPTTSVLFVSGMSLCCLLAGRRAKT